MEHDETDHLEDNGIVKELTTKSDVLPGIDNLPPPVPTSQDNRPLLPKKLPARPASEANINYISADSGNLYHYYFIQGGRYWEVKSVSFRLFSIFFVFEY